MSAYVALGNIDPIQTHSIMIIAAMTTMQASNTIVLISMFDPPVDDLFLKRNFSLARL
jgi:hypothetical protein